MSRAPHRVRISVPLEDVLQRVGANSSAAHRALLILGAHAAHYDLHACRADIGRLLGEALDEPVLSRLMRIYADCRTPVGHASTSTPTPVEPMTTQVPPSVASLSLPEPSLPPSDIGDPLAAVGIEV